MKTLHSLIAGLSLIPATALANPIMVVGNLSVEATGATHIRLRYYTNYYAAPPKDTPTYGTSHSPWVKTGETYSMNTGSGVQSMPIWSMCDCHVPTTGGLFYSAGTGIGTTGYADLNKTITPIPNSTTLCDLACAEADSRDASVSMGDAGEDAWPDTLPMPDTAITRDLPVDKPVDAPVASDATRDTTTSTDRPLPVDAAAIAPRTGGMVGPGGIPATGGVLSTGGIQSTGGIASTGGRPSSGGIVSTGGMANMGGAFSAGGKTTVDAGSGTGGEQKKSGGGCTLGGRGDGTLALLFAATFVALGRRRRR